MSNKIDKFIDAVRVAFAIENDMSVSRKIMSDNCPSKAIDLVLDIDHSSLNFKRAASALLNMSYKVRNGLITKEDLSKEIASMIGVSYEEVA